MIKIAVSKLANVKGWQQHAIIITKDHVIMDGYAARRLMAGKSVEPKKRRKGCGHPLL